MPPRCSTRATPAAPARHRPFARLAGTSHSPSSTHVTLAPAANPRAGAGTVRAMPGAPVFLALGKSPVADDRSTEPDSSQRRHAGIFALRHDVRAAGVGSHGVMTAGLTTHGRPRVVPVGLLVILHRTHPSRPMISPPPTVTIPKSGPTAPIRVKGPPRLVRGHQETAPRTGPLQTLPTRTAGRDLRV
jgi:hypothetical protein